MCYTWIMDKTDMILGDSGIPDIPLMSDLYPIYAIGGLSR